MRVLLIEDNRLVADGIRAGLNANEFIVDHVTSAGEAETAMLTGHCDIVILDLGLPDKDGMSFLRRLRKSREHVPVLILTARDAINDRVAGLREGADDYMLKPFDLEELVARLHALLRRSAGRLIPSSTDNWSLTRRADRSWSMDQRYPCHEGSCCCLRHF